MRFITELQAKVASGMFAGWVIAQMQKVSH